MSDCVFLGTIFVIEQKDLPVEEPLLDITNRDVPPTRPLSLPEEGDEDSDLNPSLITALRDKKISLKFDAFIRVCAKHLEKTQPTRSRAMYASYAQMIVQQYGEDNPCLKDLDGGSVCIFALHVSIISVLIFSSHTENVEVQNCPVYWKPEGKLKAQGAP